MARTDKRDDSKKNVGEKKAKKRSKISDALKKGAKASSKSESTDKEAFKGVNPAEAITKRASQLLAKPDRTFTVGSLEKALLRQFPAEDAQEWDRTGLTVGERGLPVSSVAIALDPTVSAIEEAARRGADVLVTHHPLFLSAPDDFEPEPSVALSSGAGVWAAIRNRIAIMSFHTTLDVSKQAQTVLPSMLGLDYKGKLIETIPTSRQKGYGQISQVPKIEGELQTLSQLAARCLSVFGRAPRVWGSSHRRIASVVTATGSASSLVPRLLDGIDCLICGEIRYHSALELSEAGVAIIELGHDVSELPLTAVLANTISEIGIPRESISIIDQSTNWTYPESIRL